MPYLWGRLDDGATATDAVSPATKALILALTRHARGALAELEKWAQAQ